MPSPTCTIGGSATPQDVSSGATVNGALANASGVTFWGVTAIGTDELNSPATVNGTLTLNQGAKTFQFTAPAGLGSAVIFQSTVGAQGSTQGHGVDVNGVYQPSYTTTFKVNVKTASGLRVMVENESFEQDTVFGWTNELNAGIRAAAGGGATTTTGTGFWVNIAGSLQAAALIGTAGQFAVTTAVLHAGFATISGDVSASTVTPGALTVTGLQGRAVASTAPTNNYVLTWSSGSSSWVPAAASGTVSVTGTGLWYSVAGALQGASLFGTAGQLPFVNAAATAVNFVSVTGDVALSVSSIGSSQVNGILGHSLPSLSAGYLQWTGAAWAFGAGAAVAWANDLAGSTSSAQYVAGLSGSAGGGGAIALLSTAWISAASGNPIIKAAGVATILSTDGSGNLVLNGASVVTLQSAGTAAVVVAAGSITLSTPTNITFAASVASPNIQQATQGSVGNPNNLTLTPQSPYASAGSTPTGTPGSLVVALAAPVSTGAEANIRLTRGGALTALLGAGPYGGATYCGLWLGPGISPGAGNFAILSDGANTYIGGSASVNFEVASTFVLTVTASSAGLGLPLGGLGAIPFALLSTATITSPTTGTITFSSAQYICPIIPLSMSLTGNLTLVFPNSVGIYFVDNTQVTFGGHAIIYKNAGGTTTSPGSQTPVVVTVLVNPRGGNTISVSDS